MAQPIDHLRNFRRGETAACEGIERASAAHRHRQAGGLSPDLFQRAAKRPFLGLGIALRERRLHDVLRESPGDEFTFDPARAVLRAADAHGRSRGAELVEPSLFRQPVESPPDRRRLEAPVGQRAQELFAPPGTDRQKAKGAQTGRDRGIRVGRRLLSDLARSRAA
jgi:hypothetical protein